MTLEHEIDALFAEPLAGFTAARNALASRLKKEGRTEDAERVKALGKPPISAWTVNQLYWRHREAFDRLLETGERFRKAQASQFAGKGVDVRESGDARRQSLAELSRLAAAVLQAAGNNASPETIRRIATTLEALSAYASQPGAPRPGRLTDDVDPPGFDALAALIPDPPPTTQKVTPAASQTEIAAAKASLHHAELVLKESEKARRDAEQRLREATASAQEAKKAAEQAERAVEAATKELHSLLHEPRQG